MAQQTVPDDGEPDYKEIQNEMMTTAGAERSNLDIADENHALSGMDSKRQAPVEAVAKNVVDRYDDRAAFLREYMANAHTACIQRAKYELREAGITDVDFDEVREVLDRAKEECSYEPVIVVKRNEDPEAKWSLKIEDNGIGITSETAYAIRDIGLSGWHDDGTTNGMFGQGTMSGFLGVDHYGEFDMTTWSVISDENYRARWKLTDLDKMPGQRDDYGTTFTFPYLIDEAKEINFFERVREYAEGMVVPVIYDHYDEDGRQDGNLSDDWGASYIEERYAEESATIVYEDQFVKAVWSPDDPDGWNTNIGTWCGYQPIDRNDSGFGINEYAMPSAFDVRVKVESGPVVAVGSENQSASETIGKVPVSQNKYDHIDEDQRDDFVVRSEISDDAIVAPKPTDDRDRFESKNVSDFMRYVSNQLEAELKDEVATVLEDIGGIEDLPDLSQTDRDVLLTGIGEYIDVYKKNDIDRLQDDIEEEFGVRPDDVFATNINVIKQNFRGSVSDEFATAVGRMKQSRLGSIDADAEEFGDTVSEMAEDVSLAPRGARKPGRARYRDDEPVYKVVEMAGDEGTVFMAKSLSCKRKVKLAWELHEDNQIVKVDSYHRWAKTFGWEKLKDLPNRNFAEKFDDHDFDDDWLDNWDPAHGSSSSSSSSSSSLTGSYDDERAKQRNIKLRYRDGRGHYYNTNGERLFDRMDDDDHPRYDSVVAYRQTEHSTSVGSKVSSPSNTAYVVVPNYVYDYLINADNIYTEDEYLQQQQEKWVDFDWSDSSWRSGSEAVSMGERDVIVRDVDGLRVPIEERGLMDEFVDTVEEKISEYGADIDVRSLTFVDDLDDYYHEFNQNGMLYNDTAPTLVSVKKDWRDYTFDYGFDETAKINVTSVLFDSILHDLDRDAPEWDKFNPSIDDTELIDALEELQENGGFVSTDDDSEAPEWVGQFGTSESEYWMNQTMERFAEETSYDLGDN